MDDAGGAVPARLARRSRRRRPPSRAPAPGRRSRSSAAPAVDLLGRPDDRLVAEPDRRRVEGVQRGHRPGGVAHPLGDDVTRSSLVARRRGRTAAPARCPRRTTSRTAAARPAGRPASSHSTSGTGTGVAGQRPHQPGLAQHVAVQHRRHPGRRDLHDHPAGRRRRRRRRSGSTPRRPAGGGRRTPSGASRSCSSSSGISTDRYNIALVSPIMALTCEGKVALVTGGQPRAGQGDRRAVRRRGRHRGASRPGRSSPTPSTSGSLRETRDGIEAAGGKADRRARPTCRSAEDRERLMAEVVDAGRRARTSWSTTPR